MDNITKPYTFEYLTLADPNQVNANFDTLYTATNTLITTVNGIPNNVVLASAYATLADAVTAIGVTRRTLLVDSAESVSDNLTIPANVHLAVSTEGTITVASAKTLTINGSFEAGLYQVFAGAGSVVGLKEARPEWWGAVGDGVTDSTTAIQAALNTKAPTRLGIGKFVISAPLTLKTRGQLFYGAGTGNYPDFDATISNTGTTLYLADGSNCNMIELQGFVTGVTGGVEMAHIYGMKLDGNKAGQSSTSHGIVLKGYNQGNRFDVRIVNMKGRPIYFESATYTSNGNEVKGLFTGCDEGVYITLGNWNKFIGGDYELFGAKYAIEISNGRGNIITGNYFEDNKAVKLNTNCLGNKVRDNHIVSNVAAYWDTEPIDFSAGTANGVSGNYFNVPSGYTGKLIKLGGQGVSLGENYVRAEPSTNRLIARGTDIDMTVSTLTDMVDSRLNEVDIRSYSSVSVSTKDGSDQTLRSITIPGYAASKVGTLRIRARGVKTGTAGARTIKIFLGSSSVICFNTSTAGNWSIDASINFLNSTTSQRLLAYVTDVTAASAVANNGTEDITTDLTLKITGSVANPADDLTLYEWSAVWEK